MDGRAETAQEGRPEPPPRPPEIPRQTDPRAERATTGSGPESQSAARDEADAALEAEHANAVRDGGGRDQGGRDEGGRSIADGRDSLRPTSQFQEGLDQARADKDQRGVRAEGATVDPPARQEEADDGGDTGASQSPPERPETQAERAQADDPTRESTVREDDSRAERADKIHSRYPDGTPVHEGEQPGKIRGPDPAAEGSPHTVLKMDQVNDRVYKAREYGEGGVPVRDIDFTHPTYPNGRPRPDHTAPEQHRYTPNDPDNPRAGYKRGPGEPLDS